MSDVVVRYIDEEAGELRDMADEMEDDPEGAEKPFVYDLETPNLVEVFADHKLGVEALKKIVRQVVDDKKTTWEASEDNRKRVAADWALFSGNLPPKTYPYKDAANMNVPIMLENITRLCFRAESELFANWNSIVVWSPIGPNDEQAAKLLTLHTNWQFRVQIPDFKRQVAGRGVLHFFAMGDVSSYSYFDPVREQNRHEILTADEFLVPYTYVSTMPDYSDVPFRILLLTRYKHELKRMKGGGWFDVDKVLDGLKPSWDDDDEDGGELGKAVSEASGIGRPEGASNAPYKLIHYEGWMDLPDPNGDPDEETQRFCRAIVHEATSVILELVVLEEENWQDRVRYDQQMAELESYRSQKMAYDQAIAQQQAEAQMVASQVQELQGNGEMGPLGAQFAGEELAGLEAAQMQLVPPVPPEWVENPDDPMAEPEPVKREPVHMFAHQVCIEPLVGTAGVSYGRIQADFNRAANVALSQFTDSATFANVRAFITGPGVKFKGDFNWSPGAVNEMDSGAMSPGSSLKDNFMELSAAPANPQLMELVGNAYTWAQSSVQAPAVLSGESGKSGETFRGLSARIEQATKQLSVPTRRYADFVELIARNNAKLNRTFLKDEELFNVAEGREQPLKEYKIGRVMYERNYHVEVRADLRFVSESQKISDADEVVGMVMKTMPSNVPMLQQALKAALIERDLGQFLPFLGQELPPPPTPLGIAPPPPPMMPGAPGPGAGGSPQGPPSGPPTGPSGPPPGPPGPAGPQAPRSLAPPPMGAHPVEKTPGLPGPGGQPPPPRMGPLP